MCVQKKFQCRVRKKEQEGFDPAAHGLFVQVQMQGDTGMTYPALERWSIPRIACTGRNSMLMGASDEFLTWRIIKMDAVHGKRLHVILRVFKSQVHTAT